MLMHASLIAYWLIFEPVGIAGMPRVTWYLAWAAVLWVVIAAVALVNSGQLFQRPLPTGELRAHRPLGHRAPPDAQ
jgi:hypothetical protein